MLCHLCVLQAWWMLLYSGGCFAVVVVLFGGCFPPFCASSLLSLGIFGDSLSSSCKFSSSGGLCLSGKIRVSSSFVLLLLSVCSVCGYGHVCVCLYFSSVFLYFFCSLCACVSQALFDYFSFVSLSTAFFLMKNIPRQGPKKKRLSSTIIWGPSCETHAAFLCFCASNRLLCWDTLNCDNFF